ncbi:MAG: hypothetical protein P8Z74_19180 [Acidobacteriota bacterium]
MLSFEFTGERLFDASARPGAVRLDVEQRPGVEPVEIWRDGIRHWILFADRSEYRIRDGEIRCHLRRPGQEAIAEVEFLDSVLPFYLQLQGRAVLHASAVCVEGKVFVFVADSGSGKSSLAVALLRRGAALVSDDVAALSREEGRFLVSPAYPQLRLWRPAAEALTGVAHHRAIHPEWQKRRVPLDGWARFAGGPCELGAVYILVDGADDDPVSVSPLGGHAGVMALMGQSIALPVLSIQERAERLAFFSDLVRNTPVRRLRFPKDFARMDEVVEAVMEGTAKGV